MAQYVCAACKAELSAPMETHECTKSVRTVRIEPDWENVAAFSATTLRDHGFQRGAPEPIIAFIEVVRYLSLNDPEAVERLLARLGRNGR